MSSNNGRILLRLDSSLHQSLLKQARTLNMSLNDLLIERVQCASTLGGTELEFLRLILEKGQKLLQAKLLGFVLFGSQARGEGRSDSDWDILLITADDVTIERSLYRRWDKLAEDIPSQVEVHFAHIPPHTQVATGFWSEIALDGIVLFEKDFKISRHLARVRREIADGLIVRKTLHGQSYWVHREVA